MQDTLSSNPKKNRPFKIISFLDDLAFESKKNNRFNFLAANNSGRLELEALISEALSKRDRLKELLRFLQKKGGSESNIYLETTEKIVDLEVLIQELKDAGGRNKSD